MFKPSSNIYMNKKKKHFHIPQYLLALEPTLQLNERRLFHGAHANVIHTIVRCVRSL